MVATRPRKDSSANGWQIIPQFGSSSTIGGTRPKVWAQVQAIDPVASHASWMENFPWTRLAKVKVPSQQKAMSDPEKLRRLDPKSVREYLNDGNYGGLYQRSDDEMMTIWRAAVEETHELLSEDWD